LPFIQRTIFGGFTMVTALIISRSVMKKYSPEACRVALVAHFTNTGQQFR